jgi:hypothetical protein
MFDSFSRGSTGTGQNAFQNLDFESANLSNPMGYPPKVPITNALPDWSASIGGVPVTEILVNGLSTGAPSIDIFGPGWNNVDPGVIDGNYTVFLQSGGIPGTFDNVSLSQSGTIPGNVRLLEFEAWTAPSVNGVFSVSFNGNNLLPVVLSSGQTASGQAYNVYGANITSYAGQSGQLEFTSIATGAPSWTEFDDISFSTVPEPNVLPLTAIGGMLFGARKWFAPMGN